MVDMRREVDISTVSPVAGAKPADEHKTWRPIGPPLVRWACARQPAAALAAE